MTIPLTATDRRPQLSPHFMFRWEASQDAYILLYPEGLIKLNPSAGEILKRCDGQHTVAELIAELQAAFPGPADDIDQGVRAFLDVATDKGWLHAGELVKKS
ncbi:MAG: pyrroloquinoline quinone biosynthesis peptide chaperone PqqD [Proteobacteria bacterium]|nr:MAG: pyrroloquinoline quinone biosynthesis peptide chaperone PqqD [Pseudomonadota bacterium]